MEILLEENQTALITVNELADFMNYGWPGPDWYLDGDNDYLWEQTFIHGIGKELYRPIQPGAVVNLHEFEAVVRWQGYGPDPSRGRGRCLTDLVLRWRQHRPEQVLIVQVPKEKLDEIVAYLKAAGCSLSGI